MPINPQQLFALAGAWRSFTTEHPKFPAFLRAASKAGIREGTVAELTLTDPEGKVLSCNLRITARDMELLEQLRGMTADSRE